MVQPDGYEGAVGGNLTTGVMKGDERSIHVDSKVPLCLSRNSTHFIPGRRPWITSNGQGIGRPGLFRVPGGHTISRRSAAAGCADAPLSCRATRRDVRGTASTLTNASDQLSGSNRAIVRAECTAAVPLAQWKQQPSSRTSTRQQPSASAEDRPFECATRRHRRPAFWCMEHYGTSIF